MKHETYFQEFYKAYSAKDKEALRYLCGKYIAFVDNEDPGYMRDHMSAESHSAMTSGRSVDRCKDDLDTATNMVVGIPIACIILGAFGWNYLKRFVKV